MSLVGQLLGNPESSLFSSQAMQASQLVGKEILVETNVAALETGGSVDAVLESSSPASNVKIFVEDQSGTLVRTFDLGNIGAGTTRFSWDGIDSEGDPAAAGAYTIRSEGLIAGSLQGINTQIFSKVHSISVDRNNTSVSLELAGNRSVGISQVSEFK